jgi:hypothetical protein
MIRLQGRSLDLMVAGTRASKLARRSNEGGRKPGATDREGRIGNDVAFSVGILGRGRGQQRHDAMRHAQSSKTAGAGPNVDLIYINADPGSVLGGVLE